jgi:tetratricopeptide (TPR) repeat protein
MGDLFAALGDDDQAASYFTRALAAREFLFGYDHIDTAESLRKLGDIHRRTGDTASAWQYYRRALHICEQSAGTTSLDTAWTLAAIALLQEKTGEYHAAYTCYQRVLQIFQQVLAPEHDDLIATRERLLALAVILGLAIAPRANDPPAV